MSIQEMLTGGDPRSLGRTKEVVELVETHQERLSELFECLFVSDEIVRMRAGDALEKICRVHAEWFDAYKERLFTDMHWARQPSLQWHLAQMLDEMRLSPAEQQRAVKILRHNLETLDEWVVTNLTLEALASFTRKGAFSPHDFVPLLHRYAGNRHKSVANRARKLLNEFEGQAA